MDKHNPIKPVRVDKWLWAARFFKTRQLAIKALKNTQITRQRQKLKPAALVTVGDRLTIQRGTLEFEVEILQLSEQRGPAKVAQTLYQETQTSVARREQQRAVMSMQPRIEIDARKPDKRKLRDSRAFKRRAHSSTEQ